MTTTIAHRQHVHVPFIPVIAVLAAVIVAAAVLILVNRPSRTTTSETVAGVASAATTAGVAEPETPALRRLLAETQAVVVPAAEARDYSHNRALGTTLDPASRYELALPTPNYLPAPSPTRIP